MLLRKFIGNWQFCKTEAKMGKPVYLDLSVLGISKIGMYKYWYDYIKPKYEGNAKLCYMDTNSFKIHVKTEKKYANIAQDVETSNLMPQTMMLGDC